MRFKSLRKSLVHIEWSFVLHRGVDQSGIQSGRGLIGLLAQISAHLPDLIAIEIDGGHTFDIAAVTLPISALPEWGQLVCTKSLPISAHYSEQVLVVVLM